MFVRPLVSRTILACLGEGNRLRIGIALMATVFPSTLVAQRDSTFVAWARSRATPLESAANPMPFRALDPVVRDARIIGVGESVHEIHQFLELRFGLLRDLVERQRVTAVALESGLPEGMDLDAYVTGRSDSIDFTTAIDYGFGRFEEVRQAFRWLREWNLGRGRRRPVRVYGVDLPGSAGSFVPALDRLAVVIGSNAPEARAVIDELRPLATRVVGGYWRPSAARYDSLSVSEKDSIRTGARRLVAAVGRARIEDGERAAWATRLAAVVAQAEQFLRVGALDSTNPRDSAMVDNTRWVLERVAPGDKLLLWAHNAHVQRAPIEGPPVPRGRTRNMGSMLSRLLGREYVAIGTAYGGPSVDSSTAPLAGSVDQVLGEVGPARYLLPLGSAGAPEAVARWLAQSRPIRFQVSHLLVPLGGAFDAIVYFDRATPAVPVSP